VSPLIPVVAAAGAPLAFGISAVAEQHGTKRVPHRAALSPMLPLAAGLAMVLAGCLAMAR
jgi:hypothetical protein